MAGTRLSVLVVFSAFTIAVGCLVSQMFMGNSSDVALNNDVIAPTYTAFDVSRACPLVPSSFELSSDFEDGYAVHPLHCPRLCDDQLCKMVCRVYHP